MPRNCPELRPWRTVSSGFALGLVLAMTVLVAARAEPCPATTTLSVTDSQGGFVGTTGTTWTVRPDCTFSVARFVGSKLAEPHRQGELTPDQKRRLAALLAKDPMRELPARVGENAVVNPRVVSIEYGGRHSVLTMRPGALDVAEIQAADPGDPRRRMLDLARSLEDLLGD
jgi:hypothetical protein